MEEELLLTPLVAPAATRSGGRGELRERLREDPAMIHTAVQLEPTAAAVVDERG